MERKAKYNHLNSELGKPIPNNRSKVQLDSLHAPHYSSLDTINSFPLNHFSDTKLTSSNNLLADENHAFQTKGVQNYWDADYLYDNNYLFSTECHSIDGFCNVNLNNQVMDNENCALQTKKNQDYWDPDSLYDDNHLLATEYNSIEDFYSADLNNGVIVEENFDLQTNEIQDYWNTNSVHVDNQLFAAEYNSSKGFCSADLNINDGIAVAKNDTQHFNTLNLASDGLASNVLTTNISGKRESWFDLSEEFYVFEHSIDLQFNDTLLEEKCYGLKDHNHYSNKGINNLIGLKGLLDKRWKNIDDKYQNFKTQFHDLLYELLDSTFLQYFNIEELITPIWEQLSRIFDPIWDHYNRIQEKFSRFVQYTNNLTRLIFESVDMSDQRSAFRKIFGFFFKNLDDESGSDHKMIGIRKRPKIAFINNYISNFNSFCDYEKQRINSGFT